MTIYKANINCWLISAYFNVKNIDRYIIKDSNISLKLVLTVKIFSLNKFLVTKIKKFLIFLELNRILHK